MMVVAAINSTALLESARAAERMYAAWREVERLTGEIASLCEKQDMAALHGIVRAMERASAELVESVRIFHDAVRRSSVDPGHFAETTSSGGMA